MKGKQSVKIGDVFQIPLRDKRIAYGQYVYSDKKNGPIVRIFNYFTKDDEKPEINKIDTSNLLFPAVYASVGGAVRYDGWKVSGSLPADNYRFTGFLYDDQDLSGGPSKAVKIKNWLLWDGNEYKELGPILPEEYMDYESVAVYSGSVIVQRIETGFDMFAYAKRHNRYLTKEELKEKYPNIKI